MTFVQDVTAIQIPMEHYIKKIKEHEARRASFNERMAYWKKYRENLNEPSKNE